MQLVLMNLQKLDFTPDDDDRPVQGVKILAVDMTTMQDAPDVMGYPFLQMFYRDLSVFDMVRKHGGCSQIYDFIFDDVLTKKGRAVRQLVGVNYVGPVPAKAKP